MIDLKVVGAACRVLALLVAVVAIVGCSSNWLPSSAASPTSAQAKCGRMPSSEELREMRRDMAGSAELLRISLRIGGGSRRENYREAFSVAETARYRLARRRGSSTVAIG